MEREVTSLKYCLEAISFAPVNVSAKVPDMFVCVISTDVPS